MDDAGEADTLRQETIETFNQDDGRSPLYDFLYPDKELLPDDKEMTIFDHLEELRQRLFVSVMAVGAAILGCFAFSKDLIVILEAPVKTQGVRFLQLAPGEFFFTTLKVSLSLPPPLPSLTHTHACMCTTVGEPISMRRLCNSSDSITNVDFMDPS